MTADVVVTAETCRFTACDVFVTVIERAFLIVERFEQSEFRMDSWLSAVIASIVVLYTRHDRNTVVQRVEFFAERVQLRRISREHST